MVKVTDRTPTTGGVKHDNALREGTAKAVYQFKCLYLKVFWLGIEILIHNMGLKSNRPIQSIWLPLTATWYYK